MLGVDGVLQHFGVPGVVEQGEGVAFGVHGALLQGGVGLAPGDGGGVHAQFGGHGHFHGGVGGTHLEVHQGRGVGQRLAGGHEVAVAEFGEHQGLKADLAGSLAQGVAQPAFVQGLVQGLLVGRGGHIGQVDGHVRLGEAGQVGGGAGGKVQGTGLGGLGGHTVTAQLAVGEQLDADLAMAFFLHQLLEFFIAHGDVVAGSHGMTETQDQRTFRQGGGAEAKDQGQGQSQNSTFTHAHLTWFMGTQDGCLCIISQIRGCVFSAESRRAKFFFQQAPVFLRIYLFILITVRDKMLQKCIIWGDEKFRRGVFSICRPHGCLRTEEGLGDATGHAADDAFWNLRPPEKL